jgi:threonine dehydratase
VTVQNSLSLADIQAARTRIAPHVRRTPILSSDALDAEAGCKLYFKCENLQAVGAFKSRGAVNAVFSLTPDEAARGVATHSSGNHAAAVSRAARLRGIPAHIVMPGNSSRSKVRNVEREGGRITFCEPTPQAREEGCARVIRDTGATLVHPYEDFRVMAGQGTAVLEFLEEVPGLDAILCPIGGGGLIAGTAVAAKGIKPSIRVIGVEPEQADDAAASFQAGRQVVRPANTIADGLRAVVGKPNLDVMLRHVDEVVTVSEAGIVAAMRRLWEELKTLVEPSSAVPYAAFHEQRIALPGKRVGIILTGGNVDLDHLPWQSGDRAGHTG